MWSSMCGRYSRSANLASLQHALYGADHTRSGARLDSGSCPLRDSADALPFGSGDYLVTFADRGEPAGDRRAEHGYGGNAECRGDVHRTAVIAHQQAAAGDERHHLAEVELPRAEP